MKRFLPILMLSGLLFGQNVLHLKSSELYTGTFYGKVGKDIVFMVEGETSTKKYSINDVNTIVTKNGELTYPFDVPISSTYKNPKNTWDFEGNSVSQSSTWSWSRSIGYSSEKIPISFYNYSLLYNIDEHSELYGTFTSYILGGGFGLGYKYYTMNKSKNLMYISAGMARYFFGEFSPDISGFSIATGVSKYKSEKTSLNIGISIYYISSKSYSRERENEFGIAPFINLERRW